MRPDNARMPVKCRRNTCMCNLLISSCAVPPENPPPPPASIPELHATVGKRRVVGVEGEYASVDPATEWRTAVSRAAMMDGRHPARFPRLVLAQNRQPTAVRMASLPMGSAPCTTAFARL